MLMQVDIDQQEECFVLCRWFTVTVLTAVAGSGGTENPHPNSHIQTNQSLFI